MTAPLLYVHPRGHLNDLVVPAGALSALNATPVAKLGRYAFEVTDEELGAARVVTLDLHWALGLSGLAPLLARLRGLNPSARVVVGGITASHYPEALLAELGVDFVVQGDAEEAFPALVAALLDGREPADLPNVWSRGHRPRLARIDQAAFEAADPLEAGWFPTLARVRDWRAAAFPMSATLPVARGCALRCPTCHGSHAAASGDGVLLLGPEAFVRRLEQARAMGLRSLRLIFGKLAEARQAALLAAAAARGPFGFPDGLGLYLCTPPSAADLDALMAAFPGRVTLSAVPPGEHRPRPTAAARAHHEAAWREVAARVARSASLQLDLWAACPEEAEATRAAVGEHGPRVTVSLGATWSLTRPTDAGRPPLRELLAALEPAWTWYAARLLAPDLEPLLAPFRLLDELPADPARAPRVAGPLGALQALVLAHWGAHRLPALPGLAFAAVPARLGPDGAAGRRFGGTRLHGDARWCATGAARLRPEGSAPLELVGGHDALRLRGAVALAPDEDAVALVPRPPPAGAGVEAGLGALGTVVLQAPPGAPRALRVQVALRVQEAELALLGADGLPLARGRAELGYFERPDG